MPISGTIFCIVLSLVIAAIIGHAITRFLDALSARRNREKDMEVAPEHEHLRRYSEILTQSSHFVAISNLLAYSADDLKKDYPSITYLDEACSLFSDVRVLEHDILALLCDYDPAVLENDIDKLCSITDRSGEVVEASTFLLNAAGTMAYNEVNDPEALKAFDCSVSSIRNYIDYVRATIEEQSLVS